MLTYNCSHLFTKLHVQAEGFVKMTAQAHQFMRSYYQTAPYYKLMMEKCEYLGICTEDIIYERLISQWELIHGGILDPAFFASPETN